MSSKCIGKIPTMFLDLSMISSGVRLSFLVSVTILLVLVPLVPAFASVVVLVLVLVGFIGCGGVFAASAYVRCFSNVSTL